MPRAVQGQPRAFLGSTGSPSCSSCRPGFHWFIFSPWCGARWALGAVGKQLSCDPRALHPPVFLRGGAGALLLLLVPVFSAEPGFGSGAGQPPQPQPGEGLAAVPGGWGCGFLGLSPVSMAVPSRLVTALGPCPGRLCPTECVLSCHRVLPGVSVVTV